MCSSWGRMWDQGSLLLRKDRLQSVYETLGMIQQRAKT